MASEALFHWARLKTPEGNFHALAEQLEASTLPSLARHGGQRWMLANGLFGLASNELLLVTAWPNGTNPAGLVGAALPAGVEVVEEYDFVATARPGSEQPPQRAGVYVHRLFVVDAANIERFVALSREAWESFETSPDYQAEPQGLFRLRDHPEIGGQMLLVTWYDRLESWERSRTPPPAARANFRERATLTKRSIAYPARLLGLPAT